jgi:sarcosine oxidase
VTDSFDVIVVGLGAMGGATAFHLARRGHRVLGLEQFEPGHARGSSHGESRIIREIYFEHPLYVPIVRRAYELWYDLEREVGERLLTVTGGLMIGPEDGTLVRGVLESAAEHAIPHEVLSSNEIRARYPGFAPSDGNVAVVDARAGYLDADACVRAHLTLAARRGAELRFDERVISWVSDGERVHVESTRGRYSARQLVVAAGPWVNTLFPDLNLPLTIERQVLVWLESAAHAEWYAPTRCPIYLWEYATGRLGYGFPRLAQGVKAAVFHEGDIVRDPDAIERTIAPEEVQAVRDALQHILPDVAAGELRDARVCPFTDTPDTHFLIDFHPSFSNVLISSPCSGHGFKFASAIGELQADLLIDGRSRFDVTPFRRARLRAAD